MIHDTIKQRLLASLLLAPPAKSAYAAASPHAAAIQANGTWEDLPAPASLPPRAGRPAHLERTLLLAKAHRAAAEAMDDSLRRALDFWLSRDPIGPDWRSNQIVVPRLVGEIALLCDHHLSAGATDKVLEILARSRWANWVDPAGWVACAGIDMFGIAYNHLLRGCLENAPAFFDVAFERIFREFQPASPDETGIQPDMTFAVGAASTGNGLLFLREGARFVTLAHGTPWQAPAEAVKLFAGFLLDGQQWLMRPGVVDAESPDDVFVESVDLEGLSVVVTQLAQLGNPPRRSELAAFARRLQGQGHALSGHRYFWRARMSVHQRPAFYASLRLGSPPTVDGRTYCLRSGHEYQGFDDAAMDHTPPGSTTFFGPDNLLAEKASLQRENTSSFLSGAVSEGDCGMAATELQRPGLSGKKAWFFFDESLVCLGTDLHGALPDRRVSTTINYGRLNGPVVARSLDRENRLLRPGQEHALRSVRTVEHDGFSYVFPTPTALIVQSGGSPTEQPANPSVSAAAFRVQIDHGSQPRGASWACIVLPTGADPEVAEEVENIEIIANTPALQAVRHRSLRLLAAAFWEPGTVQLPDVGRVAANHACVLLCRESPGGTRLSLSTLINQPVTIHVEYGGQCVAFEMAGGPDAGRSKSRFL